MIWPGCQTNRRMSSPNCEDALTNLESHDERPATALAVLRRDPLPTPQEVLDEPFAAFPSWFLDGHGAVGLSSCAT